MTKTTLCMSMIEGLARCSRERHAMLVTAEKEDECVQCIDDIRHHGQGVAVVHSSPSSELELKSLRGRGLCEKADET